MISTTGLLASSTRSVGAVSAPILLLAVALAATPSRAQVWDFDAGISGYTGTCATLTHDVAAGALAIAVTCQAPVVATPAVSINAATATTLSVVASASVTTAVDVIITAGGVDTRIERAFWLRADGVPTLQTVNLAASAGWTGTVTRVALAFPSLSVGTLSLSRVSVDAVPFRHVYSFLRDGDLEGWKPSETVGSVAVAAGVLSGTALTTAVVKPRLEAPTWWRFDARSRRTLSVRIKATSPNPSQTFRVWWGTATAPTLNVSRSVTVPFTADGTWQTLHVDLFANSKWREEIVAMWVQPFDAPESGATFAFDEIGFEHVLDFETSGPATPATTTGIAGARIADGAFRGVITHASASSVTLPIRASGTLYDRIAVLGRLDAGGPCTLGVAFRPTGGAFAPLPASITCDGNRFTAIVNVGSNPAFAAPLDALRLELPGTTGLPRAFAFEQVGLHRGTASAELASITLGDGPALIAGTAALLRATVENRGTEPVTGGKLIVDGQIEFLPNIPAFGSVTVTRTLGTRASCLDPELASVTVTGQFLGTPSLWSYSVSQNPIWIDPVPTLPPEVPPAGTATASKVLPRAMLIENDKLRVALLQDPCLGGYGHLQVYAARAGAWQLVMDELSLGSAVIDETGSLGTRIPVTLSAITPQPISGSAGLLTLSGSQIVATDLGTSWVFGATISLATGSSAADVVLTATPSQSSALRRFGFAVTVHPDVPSDTGDGAVFGGVEWLLPAEASSNASAVVGPDAARARPDPRLVMMPAMAVRRSGVTAGLLWAPGQSWRPGAQSPSPEFESSDTAHRLGLFVPPAPTFTVPGDDESGRPEAALANETLTLTATLFARTEAMHESTVRAFWDEFGTPSVVAFDVLAAELKVRSALTAAWVPTQGFSLQNGASARGYGDVATVAAALADSSGDTGLATKVADALALATPKDWVLGSGLAPSLDAVYRIGGGAHLAAAWDTLKAEDTAGPAAGAAAALLSGSAGHAGLARHVHRLARFARLTGAPDAVALAELRLGELLSVSRPEGTAATGDLPAVAPDLGATADAILAHVEGYLLTNDEAHRQRALELGFAGLGFVSPFEVSGVTTGLSPFAAVSGLGGADFTASRFGRLSASAGARAAIAFMALERLSPFDPWSSVAVRMRDAIFRRLNPVSATPATGHVSEFWDVRSNAAAGATVLPWLASRVTLDSAAEVVRTRDIATPAGLTVRLASAGTFGSTTFDPKTYNVTFAVTPTSPVRPLLVSAGNLPDTPTTVKAGGLALTKTTSLDGVTSGWIYLPSIDLVMVKVAPGAAPVTFEFDYPIPDGDGDGSPANIDCNDDDDSVYPGAGETCNAVDDDCDGDTDDPDATGYQSCGIGGCFHDEPVCILGQTVPCDPNFGKTAEQCNDVDDDCDGITDEEVGLVACGTGLCKRQIDACAECDPFLGKDDESCDGLDNDCDGITDESVGTVLCGTGRCERLIGFCDVCDPMVGKEVEVCNLIDDDCDGLTDDELPTVTCGTGLCEREIPQCGACEPLLGAKKEVCNLIDDDCDGETDDNTPTVSCGTGVCERPIPACHTCDPMVGQVPEICNGKDDDCDGVTDDAPGLKPCGTGQCYREIPLCDTCDQAVGATDEVCDGRDNDCDGQTDELTGDAICGLGACARPVVGCAACEPLEGASDEVCNAIDDDCDGEVDEAEALGVFDCGLGACKRTLPNCTDGEATACDEMAGAITEQCDDIDNDCDGITDEDIPEWTCGIGECAKVIVGCTDPGLCDPDAGKKTEVCNGKDDDCDGETDEELGYITCGELIGCPQAIPKCWNGKVLECNPSGLAPDICDGVDNDCDSDTDENIAVLTCGKGVCQKVVPGCVQGKPGICDPLAGATEEECNFSDDDCDGEIDESSSPITCGEGICEVTVSGCVGGANKVCTPLDLEKPDVCNGLDDDCDGETDENQGTITCGKGACTREIPLCELGVPQECDADTGQAPELCNNIDDDCDGETDEDLGTVDCGLGQCKRPIAACSSGAPAICDAFLGLKPEICDGLDNDCDGETDDGLGEFTCIKDGVPVKIPACVAGEPATCDTEIPGTDGTDTGDDASDQSDGQDGATGTVIAAPPGSSGCGTTRGALPFGLWLGMGLAVGLLARRRRC